MNLARLTLVLLSLAVTTQAHAGFLFEPIVGYSLGNYKVTGAALNPDVTQQNVTTTGNIDGFTYGGRAGFLYGSFFLGGEYQASRAQLKLDGAGEGTNWSNVSIFGVAGVEFALGLRIFAGMTVVPHESQVSTTPERIKYLGSAKKVGIGYRYKVPFAVNAEYVMYEFDKYEQGAVKGNVKDRLSKFDYSAVVLSLSFPFEI